MVRIGATKCTGQRPTKGKRRRASDEGQTTMGKRRWASDDGRSRPHTKTTSSDVMVLMFASMATDQTTLFAFIAYVIYATRLYGYDDFT
ncbi:hypothetical protein E5676_scaffold863G00350 [Cucumis melo var. makuwa]|uniref:Uncharacterized protein n=1 Tax=Cucumis melo var. makuwa TaxID=1194695 RepID=A0A5D3BW00_CUCMM|nr:hypothetical protein E5676_scaffold863G00350 [Cucumis melo var. makuwa]